MIPGESSWIVIFSKDSTSWGSFSYDSTEDALRVVVRPRSTEPQEVLTYEVDDIKRDPRTWIAHQEAARVGVAAGDFDAAVKELRLALGVAPPAAKESLTDLLTQLQRRVDINR